MNKKIVIPHEHGGWAMVSVPFFIGMAAGQPHWLHICLFAGWLLLYLASYPLLQAVKRTKERHVMLRWGAGYGLAAICCLIIPLMYYPQLFIFAVPLCLLLMINIYYAKQKKERALLNDICAIFSFSLAAAAAYLVGGGTWNLTMLQVVLVNFVYFIGTAFFVKTVFRERLSKQWRVYAKVYHVLALLVPFAIGQPWVILAFIFPALRTFLYAGKKLKPMKVGVLEIVGAVQFLILSIVVI
ncbi:YwiC-like family protein [Paenibacillus turicensis]|uniref:YwiC-like family protein n=1 Tax=Paenibacillus turicensis TaxID=160487 RepID=UPI003D2995C5